MPYKKFNNWQHAATIVFCLNVATSLREFFDIILVWQEKFFCIEIKTFTK
jgi:hypothetical protein